MIGGADGFIFRYTEQDFSMSRPILTGYRPGAIGRITELHGSYYGKEWGFDLFFESKVASEMAAFLSAFEASRDGFWLVMVNGDIAGSVAIVGPRDRDQSARLRWFIVAPEHQGKGLGMLLLEEAISFCRKANFREVYLTTFAGLDPARHLYEKCGFRLCNEAPDDHWGKVVREQEFRLRLRAPGRE